MTFREFMLENGYELQTTFWNPPECELKTAVGRGQA